MLRAVVFLAAAMALVAGPVFAAAYPESARPFHGRIVLAPTCDPEHRNRGTTEIYPPASRERGESGTVVLLLSITETGAVSAAKVQTSSGFPDLDKAAVTEAVTAWRFLPGTVNGKPTAMDMQIRLIFDPAKSIVPICSPRAREVQVL